MAKYSFLIGTHSYLLKCDFDDKWELIGSKKLNEGHHYGMSVARANQTAAYYCKNKDSFYDVYDKNTLSHKGKIEFSHPGEHVHQVVHANDGYYITDTKYNNLVFEHKGGQPKIVLNVNSESEDVNHINSVYICGRQVFALLHNRGRKKSEVMVIDHSKPDELVPKYLFPLLDKGCHNIYIENNYAFYNASSKGYFVIVDMIKRTQYKRHELPGHTKGLSVLFDKMVFGFSDHAEREERKTTKGHIAIIDKTGFDIIKTLKITCEDIDGEVGNINEIRCISERDYSEYYPSSINFDFSKFKLKKRFLFF